MSALPYNTSMRHFLSMMKNSPLKLTCGVALFLCLILGSATAHADTLAPALVVATSTPAVGIANCSSFFGSLGSHPYFGIILGGIGQNFGDVIARHDPQVIGTISDLCAGSYSFGVPSWGGNAGASVGIPLNGVYGGGSYVPDGIYYWAIESCASVQDCYNYGQAVYTGYYIGISVQGGAPSIVQGTGTRFDYVSPYDGETIATGTPITLQAGGYINSSVADLTNVDDTSGVQVRWNIYSDYEATLNCADVICALNDKNTGANFFSGSGYGVFDSQTFNVATSAPALPADYYKLTTSIVKPVSYFGFSSVFGFDFGYTTILATSTTFIVGAPTAQQTLIHNLAYIGAKSPAGLTATTTEGTMSSCNMISLSFNLGDCLFVLFYPNLTDFTPVWTTARDGLMSRAPWGYATRLITILSDTASTTVASSTLPVAVIAFPNTLPLYGSTLRFDFGDMLTQGGDIMNSITDPISGLSAREIFEPMIKLFIALTAIVIIFHDITGMGDDSIRKRANKSQGNTV